MSRLSAGTITAASGLALGLCLPRTGLCFLAWFALAPLLVEAARGGVRRAAGLGFWAGFCYHGLVLYWIYSTCRFAEISVPVALLAWAALAAFLALNWAAALALGRWAAQPLPGWLRPWAWAVCWTAVAVVTERWTPRIAVDLLEYTQYRHLALIQPASVFGPHGLGFLIFAANAALAGAWSEREALWARGSVALAGAAAAAWWGWGAAALLSRPAAAATAPVEILQPDVDQYQKFDSAYEARIDEDFFGLLSRPRENNPALVVWPESSLPRWVDETDAELAEASPWSRKLGAEQVVGVISLSPQGARHNAAFLLDGQGRVVARYFKRELVPFGEYVPFAWAKSLVGVLNQMSGLDPGPARQPLFPTPLGLAAPSICYEAMFPRWARFDAHRGAQLIVNVTNDGWYKGTWGPYQHFYANVYRAVENRVSVIRAGNTGISAVIDPWGVVTARLELNERGRLDAQALREDFFPRRSLYARAGDWFGDLCLLAAFGLLCLGPGLNYPPEA